MAGPERAGHSIYPLGWAMPKKPQTKKTPQLKTKPRVRMPDPDAEFQDSAERDQGIAKLGNRRYMIDLTSGQISKKLDGECWHKPVDGIITVDSTLRGREFFDTLVHEMLHGYFDESGLLTRAALKRREEIVTELAEQITAVIFTTESLRRCGF